MMIAIKELTKKYNNTTALDRISFDIPRGSVFGFLGPNGAGKTTLIRILTGLIIPDSGEVKINGESVNKLNVKRIGYLPEERGLYKKMKVGEQAVYLAVMKGLTSREAEKRLKQWFEKLEISDWWNKTVESLSKGMQQKIQFVISAIHQPDMLILDEPLSGLDPINREVLGNEITELNKKGMTIVLSTHDMNSVEQFCNSVILMDKGKIILSGNVDEIKQSKKSRIYEFCLKRNNDLFVEQCSKLNAGILSEEKTGYGYHLHVRFENEQDPETVLSNTLKQTGLVSFREVLPSMHDIFVESVKSESL
jgi:ABC-2 type transport system ATP-binding protein